MADALGTTINSLPSQLFHWLFGQPVYPSLTPHANAVGIQGPMVARPPGSSFIDQSKAYNEGELPPGDHSFDEGQYGNPQDFARDRAFVDRLTQHQLDQMFNQRMDAYDAQDTVNELKAGLPIRARRGKDI
jgi:hypothetical protein